MKKSLIALTSLFLACLLILAIVFLVVSRDIPLGDTSDLVPETIELPPEQNASTHFVEAKNTLYRAKPSSLCEDYLTGKPTDAALIEDVITRNTATFEAVERGLACRRCITPATPGSGYNFASAWEQIGKLIQPNKTKLIVATLDRKLIKDASRTYANTNHPENGTTPGEDQSSLKHFLQPNLVGKRVAKMQRSICDLVLQKKYQGECSIAATRLLLACNAYQAAEGKLPDDLSALVPLYLSAIPADPYDGKPFRYAPAKGIVHSVGKDLKDSGGSTNRPAGERAGTPAQNRSVAEDVVFDLRVP